MTTESVSKATFIMKLYKLSNGFTQTFPPMRLKSSGRAVQAIINPEFSGIFEDVNMPAIMVRPGKLENVAANLSSHLRC